MTESSPNQSLIVDQSEGEVVGWGRFVRSLVARGFLVVSLSFIMGGDSVQQRGVIVQCSDGSHVVVPASELEAFVTSGCSTPDIYSLQDQQWDYFPLKEY